MSKKIWITAEFDCLIKNKEEVFLKANLSEVCLQLEGNDYFFVYPTNDGISYVVAMQNDQLIENQHILVDKYFEDEYRIKLLPYCIDNIPSKCYTNKIGQYVQSLFVGKKSVYCLEYQGIKNFCTLNFEFCDFKFLNFQNIPLLLVDGEVQRLFGFDKKNQKFSMWKGKIDVQKDTIKIVSPYCDIAHRADVLLLESNQGELVTKSKDMVYLDGYPVEPKEDGLIPFAFFEAIRAGDFYCAKSMMDKNIQIQSQQVFEDYFGKFDKITPYNYVRDKGYFVALSDGQTNKIYKLKIQNQKIVEIEKLERKNGVDKFC